MLSVEHQYDRVVYSAICFHTKHICFFASYYITLTLLSTLQNKHLILSFQLPVYHIDTSGQSYLLNQDRYVVYIQQITKSSNRRKKEKAYLFKTFGTF